jgi:hypothetical protein
MPSFSAGPDSVRTPFGKNEFLRSTQDVKTESYTFWMDGIPTETIDTSTNQKVLQPGTVLAKATSGTGIGKVGVFDSGAADGRQTPANIVGLDQTFLPWQLIERDVEVAAVVEARVKQAWCFEYVAGVRTPLTNATRDAILALPNLAILFS